MRILLVNTLLFEHGGPSIYMFNLGNMLRENGHEVEYFGMQHPNNGEFSHSDLFPPHIDFPELLKRGGLKNSLTVLRTMLNNRTARAGMEQMLDAFRPDVVHLQNYLHHLSPSVIYPVRSRNIPVVWTLHDSVLACPNTNLFDDHLMAPCTLCNSPWKRYIYPPLKRCKKDSFGASCAAAVEAFYFSLIGLVKMIDFFVVPSRFLRRQLSIMGVPVERFRHIPNYVELEDSSDAEGDYFVYLGRLVREKGVLDLVNAVKGLDSARLEIIGDGPLRDEIEKGVSGHGHIHVNGYLRGGQLERLLKRARFIVLPSICYENAPLSLLETMRYGKPAVGSDIGGIPEMVIDGKTGLLFKPGDIDMLRNRIEILNSDQNKRKELGGNARELVLDEHTPEKHLQKILSLYTESRER